VATVLLASATFWAGTLVKGERRLPPNPKEPRPTVPLERRVLTDELRLTGTVGVPSGVPVSSLSPSLNSEEAALITKLPLKVGAVVTNGSLLAEIAGHPVIVLEGGIPMYRTLRLGSNGGDILEFQQALSRNGYGDADPPGHFGQSTSAAAAAMFRARGYSLPDERILRPASFSGGVDNAAIHSRASRHVRERVPIVPLSSVVFVGHLPASVSSLTAHVGQQADGPLLTLTYSSPNVVVGLEPSQLQTVRRGMRVRSSAIQHGEGIVSSVKRQSKPGEQTGGEATVSWPHQVRLPHIGAEVEVSIVRASSRHPVWCVPFSAIQSGPGTSSYVEVESAHERFIRVDVTLGLSVGGYVAITPRARDFWHVGEPIATGG
jgi:HlyD family secretion protein